MASEAQIAANQRNARKSTGPQTAAGKAAVGRNALRHGLCSERVVIFEESAADFDEFAAGIQAVLAPADAYENALAERIVQIEWRLRRVWRMEAAAIDAEAAAADCERARKAAASALFADWTANPPTGPQAPSIEQARRAMRQVAAGWNDDELQDYCASIGAWTPGQEAAQWPQKLAALGRYEAALERQLNRATRALECRQAQRREDERANAPAAKPAPAPQAAIAPRQAALPSPPPALAAAPPILKNTKQSQFAAPPPRPSPASVGASAG